MLMFPKMAEPSCETTEFFAENWPENLGGTWPRELNIRTVCSVGNRDLYHEKIIQPCYKDS
jgi:hypothetical protein